MICDAAGGTPAISNWEIYGNIFFWDAAFASDSQTFIGDGRVGLFGQTTSGHLYFYNNTIYGFSTNNTCNSSAVVNVSQAFPTTVIENNLWEQTTNCQPNDGELQSITTPMAGTLPIPVTRERTNNHYVRVALQSYGFNNNRISVG